MVQNVELPFSFRGPNSESHDFVGIRELGFNERGAFVVFAHTSPVVPPGEPRGSYFTSIPISSAEWRRANNRQTHATYARHGSWSLTIRDDWGSRYVIDAPSFVIDTLVAECVANDIPEEKL